MKISCIACALAVGIALAAGPAALAQRPYSFTNVIDTTIDPNVGGNEGLAIDGDTVAIHKLTELYTMTGGVRTTIAKVGDSTPAGTIENFDVFGALSLSGANVAFIAETSGATSVLYGSGGPLTKVAREGDTTPEGQISFIPQDSRASISGDKVAFTADVRPSLTSTVFVSSGGVLTTIAPPAPTITYLHVGPTLSGNRAAFQESNFSDMAIYSGTGGALTTIMKSGDPAPIGTFRPSPNRVPEISGDVVAFHGFYTSGHGIFTGNGGPLTTIVRTGDAPAGNALTDVVLGQTAANGQQVSFLGRWSNDVGVGVGVFVSDGGVIFPVIKRGDMLFGQPLGTVRSEKIPLDPGGSGRVAFGYVLANGVRGIAIATPVPEPGGVVLIMAAGCVLAAARVNRRRSGTP